MEERVSEAIINDPYFPGRAAILAMREPTNAMHRAARSKRETDRARGRPTPWGDVWRAMIDAALDR
jgi:hypothetical protein